MNTSTISSKGQLTIPKRIREQLDLKEGDQVVIVAEDERIALYPIRRRGLRGVRGALAGLRPYPGRDTEREAAMREAAREALGLPEEDECPG